MDSINSYWMFTKEGIKYQEESVSQFHCFAKGRVGQVPDVHPQLSLPLELT